MSKKANLEWIKELVQQGKTVKEIALETEYAEGTIRKHLKSLGLRANSKKAYITDEVIQEIIRLNKDGLTNKAIGEKLNMNASTVRKYLLENGLESCSERSKSISKKEPKIKWVNDIFIDGKKVCGILTEAVTDFESGGLEWVVLGIGINV